MTYLLDTDVFTLAYHATHGVRERIDAAEAANVVAVTVVTRIEVLRGRFEALHRAANGAELLRRQSHLVASEAFLGPFEVVPFDDRAAAVFDRLRDEKRVRKIGRPDLLTACIALAHGAVLVTRNLKDFRPIPGLTVENWAA